MKFLVLTLTCLISFGVFAQGGKLKKANNYFERLSYAYAAGLYEDLIGSEVDSPEMKAKLAYSYLKMGEAQKSVDTYAKMIESSASTLDDYYNYAYALKQVGKYTESDKWMQKYSENITGDTRADLFLANENYKSKIENIDPFFSLESMELNSSASDFGGYLNPSEDEFYFITARRNPSFVKNEWAWDEKRFLDIFYAPIQEDGVYGKVKKVKKVNTRFHEGPITFSLDGKTVYYTRDNISPGKKRKDGDNIQNLKLYISDINEKGKWVNEREFPYNSKDYSVGHPALSPDGNTLYLVSDMPGGIGGSDIYKVAINEDGSFGEMINLGDKVNTKGQEMFPFVDAEGKVFFASDGLPGLGGLDVFVAILTEDGEVDQVHNLGTPVNTRYDDFALTLTKDLQQGYVSSNRDGGQGGDDIYAMESLRPIVFGIMIKGKSLDKDGNAIPSTAIVLKDEDGNVLETVTSDEEGNYSFSVDRNKEFALTGSKEDYFDGTNTVSTKTDESIVETNVVLEKDPGISLLVIITDAKTGEPIDQVQVSLTDNMLDRTRNDVTPASGELIQPLYSKRLGDRGSYNIVLQKEGYFTKTATHNIKFVEPGQYKIEEALDPVVEDLAEMVQINPINFDLNKYNIRPDAAVELDKIVEIMTKYPNMIIELGAHTDCRGTKAYNMNLSDKRAKASADYIKKNISNPERIYGKGYGESRLLNGCECEGSVKSTCSEEEHAINRRTEFKVISTGDDKVKVNNTSPDSF